MRGWQAVAKKKKRKSRKGSGKAKGSAFEREISKRLSLWWTDDASSQVFWRNSGFLSRAGDRKEHQYGDVHAIDERGKWLVENVSIELKFYKDLRILDIVDKPGKEHVMFLKHGAQCKRDAVASNREPMLIAKRNFAEPFVVCYSDGAGRGRRRHRVLRWGQLRVRVRAEQAGREQRRRGRGGLRTHDGGAYR